MARSAMPSTRINSFICPACTSEISDIIHVLTWGVIHHALLEHASLQVSAGRCAYGFLLSVNNVIEEPCQAGSSHPKVIKCWTRYSAHQCELIDYYKKKKIDLTQVPTPCEFFVGKRNSSGLRGNVAWDDNIFLRIHMGLGWYTSSPNKYFSRSSIASPVLPP